MLKIFNEKLTNPTVTLGSFAEVSFNITAASVPKATVDGPSGSVAPEDIRFYPNSETAKLKFVVWQAGTYSASFYFPKSPVFTRGTTFRVGTEGKAKITNSLYELNLLAHEAFDMRHSVSIK